MLGLYIAGFLLNLIFGGVALACLAKPYESPFDDKYEDKLTEYRNARAACARVLLASPVWPLSAAWALIASTRVLIRIASRQDP